MSKTMEFESESAVRCPKCARENGPDIENCQQCGAHLFVLCRDCGVKNERADKKCSACGTDLHRIKRKRKRGKFFAEGRTIRFTIAGALILIGIAVWAALRFFVFKEPK
jgi:hypothetical protein